MIFFMRIAQNQHFHVTLLIFQAKNLCISALIRTFALDHQRKLQWKVGVTLGK